MESQRTLRLSLSSRERVKRAVEFRGIDRIPLMHAVLPAAWYRFGGKLNQILEKYPKNLGKKGKGGKPATAGYKYTQELAESITINDDFGYVEGRSFQYGEVVKSLSLPVKGIIKYQRATNRVIKEGVAGNVLDNTPPEKIKGRFARFFNVTGSRRTLDRWKHKEADKLNFKDLIEKLKPSKVLCLDDLDPERSTRKHLIISDRIKRYILYLDALLDQSEEEVVKYLTILKGLGINEVTCFIVDMRKSFPPAIHKVYPEAKIQYDYFHIWEAVNRHLDNAMKDYSRYLRYVGFPDLAKRVWCYRRTFLKHPKRYTDKDKEITDEIILSCRHELPANILVLEDQIRDIFEKSSSEDEAYEKKNKLYFEGWHKKNRHFKKIIKLFINVPMCEYMFTYLKEPDVLRSGNSENSIKLVRSWENPRYGFRTTKGLQDHLKLYQKMKYLGQI